MIMKFTIVNILLLAISWGMVGCAPIRIPVDLETTGTALGSITLKAGVPSQGTVSFGNFDAPVIIGNGSVEIKPGVVSISPIDTSGNKKIETLQQVICSALDVAESFIESCLLSGSSQAECEATVLQTSLDCLGDVDTLEATCWINDDATTVFTNGDAYGPYRIMFDESGQSVSVNPQTVELTSRTIGLLNAGTFSVGCKFVIGQDVSMTLGSLTLNLGL